MFSFSLNPKLQAVDASSLRCYYLQFLLRTKEATAVLQEDLCHLLASGMWWEKQWMESGL